MRVNNTNANQTVNRFLERDRERDIESERYFVVVCCHLKSCSDGLDAIYIYIDIVFIIVLVFREGGGGCYAI